MVEGRLKLDQWDDKATGQKRSKLGVVLENFQFMDSGRTGGEGGHENAPASSATSAPASSSGRVAQATPPPADDADALPSEDDVPF